MAGRVLGANAHGPDVLALQIDTDRRLKARNQGNYLVGAHDGVLGYHTARGVRRSLYLLGCLEETYTAAYDPSHGRHVEISVGAQRLIHHPELRSPHQLDRAAQRLHLVRDKTIHPVVKPPSGIHACTAAAQLGLAHAPALHYTMGPQRWEGILHKDIARRGQFPHYADCSAFYTWCLWQLLQGGPDVVNGADWLGGYTGTLLAHGRRVAHPIEGAAVLYGRPGSTGEHVAYSLGDGYVISNGSEGGPYHLPYNYRDDIMEFRVYA